MEAVYLDTHVIVWLYQKDLGKFPANAIRLMENNDLLISPMVILELVFLKEIGRLRVEPMLIVNELQTKIGLQICDQNFSSIIFESMDLSWTRDPFDRLIVANALATNARLISKDGTILRHYQEAIWS